MREVAVTRQPRPDPDGTAALRGPAATDPDIPAGRAASDGQSAAASQNVGIRRRGHQPPIGQPPLLIFVLNCPV
jgi:hypothetical protein